jgi:hypothetical protein
MGEKGKGVVVFSKVTRESLAVFLPEATEGRQWDRRTPVIMN